MEEGRQPAMMVLGSEFSLLHGWGASFVLYPLTVLQKEQRWVSPRRTNASILAALFSSVVNAKG